MPIFDSSNLTLVFEQVDLRNIECYDVTDSSIVEIRAEPVLDNVQVYWNGISSGNKVNLAELLPDDENDTRAINFKIEKESLVPSNTKDTFHMSYFTPNLDIFHTIYQFQNSLLPEAISRRNMLKAFVPYPEVPNKVAALERLEVLRQIPFTMTQKELDKAYDDERSEYEDSDSVLREKVAQLAELILEAKHCVFYTGAGISTSANIPDFRGPNGIWTLRDKGQSSNHGEDKTYPTLAHYAITDLARRGLVKYIISTNMDALHLRTGLPRNLLNEQHGNSFMEYCERCGLEFFRQYDTLDSVVNFRQHFTGRRCTFCAGRLRDSIVHFSEPVKPEVMLLAMYHARKSDLSVVLGTSMNVQPSACFPDKSFQNGGKMVIINLQKTPYDSLAAIRIFGRTDKVMNLLMQQLGISTFDVKTDIFTTWDD